MVCGIVLVMVFVLLAIFGQTDDDTLPNPNETVAATIAFDEPQRHRVAAGDYHTVVLFDDGTVTTVGDFYDVEEWTDIVSVAAGYAHTVGLRSDGTVVATGSNEYGQFDVSGWTDIVSVYASVYNTAGIRNDGSVVVAGYGANQLTNTAMWQQIGDLGFIYAFDDINPTAVELFGLRADGRILSAGNVDFDEGDLADFENITDIVTGEYLLVALENDDTVEHIQFDVYEFGMWSHFSADYALMEEMMDDWQGIERVYANYYSIFGETASGQILSTETIPFENAAEVVAGGSHIVAVLEDGTLVAYGDNSFGQCDVQGLNIHSTAPI